MRKHQDNTITTHAHDEFVHLIPWYLKGQLSVDESDAVKQHLSSCESCQQELLSCQKIAESLPDTATTWKPSAAHFAGILANLDKLEAASATKQIPEFSTKSSVFDRIQQLLSQTPNPIRWTLAAEALAVILLAAVVMPSRFNSDIPRSFETLSNAQTPATLSGTMLRVVFSENMSTKELSELLLQNKAQINQGPTAVGVYTIQIPHGYSDQVQATFKSHPKVSLVLPVTTDTPP